MSGVSSGMPSSPFGKLASLGAMATAPMTGGASLLAIPAMGAANSASKGEGMLPGLVGGGFPQ